MTAVAPNPKEAAEAAANDVAAPGPALAAPGLFPALVVGDEAIDCDHLAPFGFVFDTPTCKGVHCHVQFSTHCFSDKYNAARHPEHVVVVDERGQLRCFDWDRYELSKGLETLIRGLPTIKVFQTPESNFAIITRQDGREYRVFFNVRREARKKLKLYVESAYPPEAGRSQILPVTAFQKVRFGVLADRVLGGQPLNFRGR